MNNETNTRVILGSKRYKTAIDTDLEAKISLEGSQRELDEFDRNSRISLAQVFDDERQASTTFRPTANIDLIFYNIYSGSTGLNPYSAFTNSLSYVNQLNSFNTSMWSGYPQYHEFDLIRTDFNVPGYTTNNGSILPHVKFTNKYASTYNWVQYISYAYENDYNKTLEYYWDENDKTSWVCSNGIPFNIQNPYFESGQDLISFICPVEHGLSVGEYVELNIPGWQGYEGTKVFPVYSLGQSGYNSDKYIFNIYNYGFIGAVLMNGTEGAFRRIIDVYNSGETKSEYYVRRHRIITNSNDAILNRAGFDLNSFDTRKQYEFSSLTPDHVARITTIEGNQSYLLSFYPDIDISQYRDNLNRPVTELFVTIINRGFFGWFNRPMDLMSQNYPGLRQGFGFNITASPTPYWAASNRAVNKTNISTNNYVKQQGGNNFTFYYNNVLVTGDTIDGAFCEFNKFEQRERVISDAYHKIVFNENLFKVGALLNADPITLPQLIDNPPGYYYKPHHRITLKVYSDYVEEGKRKEMDSVPDYAFYSEYYDRLRWRDLYTYGYVDSNGLGVDYPFLNGSHYPSTKIIFRVFPEGNVPENIYAIAEPISDECE